MKTIRHMPLASPQLVSGFTFACYMVFVVDYFVRISARIPGMGIIRPTLLMVLIISWLLFLQFDKFKDRFSAPSAQKLKALLIYIALSLPLVAWPGSVLKDNIPNFIKAIVFFYFTLAIIDSPERLKKFLIVFISCQLLRVLEPLFLHITTGYWGDKTYMGAGSYAGRLGGGPYDIINANELGFVIVTLIPFLHYLLPPQGKWGKIIYFLLLPVLLYALVLTMSRGSFLALLVVGFFIFKRSKRKFSIILAAIMMAIIGWSQMSDVQKDRYLSLTGADVRGANTAAGRITGIEKEFELALESPIFGHGVGTTPEAKFNSTGHKQAAHNLYAELIIEIGIIGFFIFLRFVFAAYLSLKMILVRNNGDSVENGTAWIRNLVDALQVIFWMYLFYSFNYWGLSNYYWYLFCGLCLVTYYVSAMDRKNSTSGEKNMTRFGNK